MVAAVAGLVGLLNVTTSAQNQPATRKDSGHRHRRPRRGSGAAGQGNRYRERISYTVFTTKGRLPDSQPSRWQVLRGDCRRGVRGAGPDCHVTSAGTTNGEPDGQVQAGDHAGCRSGRGSGTVELRGDASVPPMGPSSNCWISIVLYPPSPARDVMVKECFTCHGPTGWHRSGPRSEAQWRRAVQRMFDADGRVAGMSAWACRRPPTTTCQRTGRKHHQVPDRELRARIQAARSEDRRSSGMKRRSARRCTCSTEVPPPTHAAFEQIGCLWRSADPIAAFGLGQRRQSGVVYMSGNRSGLDRRRRHQDSRSGEADEGMAHRQRRRTSWSSRTACSTCRTATCTSSS